MLNWKRATPALCIAVLALACPPWQAASSALGQTPPPAAARAGSLIIDHTCVDASDKIIPIEALDKARGLKVLLGHESVGWNVIQGLERLSREGQRYRLDIMHMVDARRYAQHSGLGDFFVANANNVPGKAQAFEAKLRSGVGDAVQVASLKLCWADLQMKSDPDAAFNAYVQGMEKMQKAYPRVRFVYWTMPLRREAMMQEKRARFNELMYAYARQHDVVLFDIADIECHKPDGGESHNETGQKALWEGYTSDGGHLNEAGSARAARAWWWLTARLSGWPGPK